MMRLIVVVSALAVGAIGTKCNRDGAECESERTVDHYSLMGMIDEMLDTAMRFPTTLKDYKKLNALLNDVMSMQSPQEDFLPKRTSYDDAITNLEAWAKKRYHIDGVTAGIIPGMGGAVFATKNLKLRQVVLNISSRDVLSSQQAEDDYTCLGGKYASSMHSMRFRVSVLILLLLKHAYDEKSEFRPYIDSLPIEVTHPAFFTYEEMVALKGSPVLEAGCFKVVQEMAGIYASLYRRLDSNPECGERIGVPLEKFTLKAF